MGLFFLLLIGCLILNGMGASRMADHVGIDYSILAFLPFGYTWIIGKLGERSCSFYTGTPSYLARNTLTLSVAMFVCLFIAVAAESGFAFFLMLLLFIAVAVYQGIIYYYIFKDYAPGNEILFLILSVVTSFAPILMLIHRDTVPVSVTGYGYYSQPKYTSLGEYSPDSGAQRYQPYQGYSPQGYSGYQPPQGYHPQGYSGSFGQYQPPQGYNPQGYNPQGYNPQGYNPQGYNPQGYNPQGYSQPQAVPGQPQISTPQSYIETQSYSQQPQPGTQPPQGHIKSGYYPAAPSTTPVVTLQQMPEPPESTPSEPPIE